MLPILNLAAWLFLVARAPLAAAGSGTKITIKNSCSGTIYPAYAGSGGQVLDSKGAAAPTGWELAAGGTTDIVVPSQWTTGRIWARTGGCNGDVSKCKVGGCGGQMTCSRAGGQGATLAEFQMGGNGGGTAMDFYDVSMVDGFSIPISIEPAQSSCVTASCGAKTDLLMQCDASMVTIFEGDSIYSCGSACLAGVQFSSFNLPTFDPNNSPSCCTGTWLNNCPTSGIPFYQTYKDMCTGYVFADDDRGSAEGTMTGCAAGGDLTVEFCPNGLGSGLDSPPTAAASQSAGGALQTASIKYKGGAGAGLVTAQALVPGPAGTAGSSSSSTSASATSTKPASKAQSPGGAGSKIGVVHAAGAPDASPAADPSSSTTPAASPSPPPASTDPTSSSTTNTSTPSSSAPTSSSPSSSAPSSSAPSPPAPSPPAPSPPANSSSQSSADPSAKAQLPDNSGAKIADLHAGPADSSPSKPTAGPSSSATPSVSPSPSLISISTDTPAGAGSAGAPVKIGTPSSAPLVVPSVPASELGSTAGTVTVTTGGVVEVIQVGVQTVTVAPSAGQTSCGVKKRRKRSRVRAPNR